MRKILKYAVMLAMVLTAFGFFCFICCMAGHGTVTAILVALLAMLSAAPVLNIMSAALLSVMTEQERKELE